MWAQALISLRWILGMELLGHMVRVCLTVWVSNCQTGFQSGCASLHYHQRYIRMLVSPHPWQHSILSIFCISWDYALGRGGGQGYHGCDVVLLSASDQKAHRVIYLIMSRLTLINWLRWCVPGFSKVKLLFFPLSIISIPWGDTLRLCKHPVSH